MRNSLAAFIFCFLLGLTDYCQAWSEAGHIVIAELAYGKLPAQVRITLRDYANVLLAGAPESRASWFNRYPGYSAASYTAAWPDTIRDRTLEDLFRHYGTTVPAELEKYRHETTNNWHYANRWYYGRQGVGIPKHCRNMVNRFTNNGELLPVIARLYSGFKNSDSDAQRAVMLALLIHLLSDLHQPLHNFAGAGDDCQHDRGGSRFCLVRRSPDTCELNLHRLWDSGVGLFEPPVNLRRVEKWIDDRKLQSDGAVSVESIAARVKAWSDESREYTAGVYALEEGTMPDSNYIAAAQAIVKIQTIAAAERLGAVLLTLINQPGVTH